MARPTALPLNRAAGITSARQQAAPGLAVQAPLDVNVGQNSLQGLADILGVGANIAIGRAQQESQLRVQEDTELLNAQAEADVHGDTVDEEQYRTSRTYRRRVDTLSGARQGVEMSIAMRNAADQFVRDNPLADEQELRTYLQDWQNRELLDDQGNPIAALSNPRSEAILRSSLSETGYAIISGHRQGWQQRVTEQGTRDAVGLFLANGELQGGTSMGDLEGLYMQLRGVGNDPQAANGAIVNAALSMARTQRNPEILDMLPEAWQEGTLGPRSDPEMLTLIDTQRAVIENIREAELREGQWQERLSLYSVIDDQIMQGIAPTEEQVGMAQTLGVSPEVVSGWRDQANRTAAAILEEQQREAEAAMEHQNDLAEYRLDPWSATDAKAEELLGVEYTAAVRAGNEAGAMAIVREAIARNVLPRPMRNQLNRVPPNAQAFQTWHRTMRFLDNEDDQVFASLSDDARAAYNAYNGLMSLGRFTPEQAFTRMQARDAERGREFTRSEAGDRAISDIVGSDADSLVRAKAAEIVQGFAALEDFTDEEVASMAEQSFNQSYLVYEGRIFPRSMAPDERFLDRAREGWARTRTESGTYTDPDDYIIASIDGTDTIVFRSRDGLEMIPANFSDIRTAVDREVTRERGVRQAAVDRRADVNRNRERRDADSESRRQRLARERRQADREEAAARQLVVSAVGQDLNPWRRIDGESEIDRQFRAGRENQERRRRGLQTYSTPTSWNNAHR